MFYLRCCSKDRVLGTPLTRVFGTPLTRVFGAHSTRVVLHLPNTVLQVLQGPKNTVLQALPGPKNTVLQSYWEKRIEDISARNIF